MSRIFALFFLTAVSLAACGQENFDFRVYNWEEVQSANPDTIFGISFEKLKLESVPPELARFKQLKSLDFQKNKLKEIPEFISAFPYLEKLNLEKNLLEYFPIQICRMKSLTHLVLSRNYFESVPECIGMVTTLVYMDFYDTPIRHLPQSVENLKNLKEIDFSGIKFSPTFQKSWIARLPNVKVIFDAPCDCME
ncbi:MAG: leucine-rich repeat domain-containing protein [Crocinitomicaceae bacterium]